MLRFGIRSRLVASVLSLLVFALWLTSSLLLDDADQQINSMRQKQLQYQARMLSETSLDALITQDVDLLGQMLSFSMPSKEYAFAAIIDTDGLILAHSNGNRVGKNFSNLNENTGTFPLDKTLKETTYRGRPVMEASYPIMSQENHLATARVAYFLDIEVTQRDETISRLIGIMVATSIMLMIGVSLIINKFIDPIRHLTWVVSGLSIDNGIKIPMRLINRTDEAGALACAFDNISHRLLNSYKELKAQSQELENRVEKRTQDLEQQTHELESSYKTLKSVSKELQQHRDHLQDIVEQKTHALKESETKAIAAMKDAERANNTKSEFLTNISHELRTPMHAIISYAKLGLGKADKITAEDVEKYFSRIYTSGDRLVYLLNDLLDVSKLEAGQIEMTYQEKDMLNLVNKCKTDFAEAMKHKGLVFELKNESTNSKIQLDEKRITQVISNLLSNAIKFSPDGLSIQVKILDDMVKLNDDQEVEGLHISVEDHGIGIPENEKEEIFESFVQSSKTKSGAGGKGLGLSICKNIILAHQGKIWTENSSVGGAIFHFVIPKVMPTAEIIPIQSFNGEIHIIRNTDASNPGAGM